MSNGVSGQSDVSQSSDMPVDTIPVIGVDTGGTFTDFYYPGVDGVRTLKVLSTPHDPGQAIIQGLQQLGLNEIPCLVIHGTTVGTNAVLEGKGAAVVYITNQGFADVLTIGRQQRRQVYALHPLPRPQPVSAQDCVEVDCRLDVDGQWLQAPSEQALRELRTRLARRKPEAIAVNLIHGWCAPQAEALIADCCPRSSYIACGSSVLPEAGEYERGIATWLQASIGPVMSRYLSQLQTNLPEARIRVMQSDGMTLSADQAGQRAVHLLLSGPAGGVAAATHLAQVAGVTSLLTFDMGGTSTDVAMVSGEPQLTSEGEIGPWPVSVPMVDIHTIGAGGGSLVTVDAGGLMQVGPESAGADPGPACYGRGGTQATVTDAHVVLGRIPATQRLAGGLPLDVAAARAAVARIAQPLGLDVETTAAGIIRLANEQMSRALRVVSADRGHDPAQSVLLSFGGAGGLHGCELAQLLGIRRVLIAPHAGVLSALGMTVASPGRRQVHSVLRPLAEVTAAALDNQFQQLRLAAEMELSAEGYAAADISHQAYLGLRYQGQKLVMSLPWKAGAGVDWNQAFAAEHRQRCGYILEQALELAQIEVASRVTQVAPELPRAPAQGQLSENAKVQIWNEGTWCESRYLRRDHLGAAAIHGPAVIGGSDTTLWIPPLWTGAVDHHGLLWLRRD